MSLVQSVAVLLTVVSDDTATDFVPADMGNVAQWCAALVALLALILAAVSARWAAKQWLRGSVKVFVHPNRWWFRENSDAYDKKFVKYVNDNLANEGGNP